MLINKVNVRVDGWNYIEWRNESGKLHREDGPAEIGPNGDEYCWLNGDTYYMNTDGSPGTKHTIGWKK